jgi:hypothetical protein
MTTNDMTTDPAEQIVAWLRGQRFGDVEVLEVETFPSAGLNHEPIQIVQVTLADPRPDQLTWASDDMWALRRAVRDYALPLLGERRCHVTALPVTPNRPIPWHLWEAR